MRKAWRGPLFGALYFLLLGAAVALLLLLDAPRQEESRKIGFIMTGRAGEGPDRSAAGARAACEAMDVELLLRDQVPTGTGACKLAVAELAEEGAEMIILSSPSYAAEMQESFDDYPQIYFYAPFANIGGPNLTGFSTRMYQARYLSGIVAGMYTKTGKIGFVSTVRSSEACRGIDAFALGVRRVRPEAEVVVAWTGGLADAERETRATQALIEEEGVDVITHHQGQYAVVDAAEAAGIASIGYYNKAEGTSERYLTCAACDWEILYKELIREYLRGQSSRVVNDWLGLETGVVGLTECSPLVSQAARDEVEKAKAEILSGMDVFTNEIYDNEGRLRCGAGESMSDAALQERIDWLVEGVQVYE